MSTFITRKLTLCEDRLVSIEMDKRDYKVHTNHRLISMYVLYYSENKPDLFLLDKSVPRVESVVLQSQISGTSELTFDS